MTAHRQAGGGGNWRQWWLWFSQATAILAALLLMWQLFRPPPTQSYRDILGRALPSVVGVYGSRGTQNDNVGSGVIVDDGHILTNYHLVANMRAVKVDINGETRIADVVGVDPEIDIALLRVEAPAGSMVPIVFAESDIQQGDVVFAIGNPYGLLRSASMGIVSAVGRNQLGINRREYFIQTDAAINPGNSGGALTNAHGELVGINSALFARYSPSGGSPQGIGFAVPSDIVRRSLDDFLPPHLPAATPMGAEVRPMSNRLHREILDFAPEYVPVMLISRVWSGTPAAAMGLLPGDIVLEINGEVADNLSETGVLPLSMQNILILRAGERLQLDLSPIEQTAE